MKSTPLFLIHHQQFAHRLRFLVKPNDNLKFNAFLCMNVCVRVFRSVGREDEGSEAQLQCDGGNEGQMQVKTQ